MLENVFLGINYHRMDEKMENSKIIMERLLEEIIAVYEQEPPEIRPRDSDGKPGGIIVLRQDLPTLIVPDLHGRKDYLPDLMHFKYKRKKVFDLLNSGKIQIAAFTFMKSSTIKFIT